jgi:hypothetical protein
MITRPAFIHIVEWLYNLHDWRYGQAMFNAAVAIGASPLPGTLIDPFYNDGNTEAFMNWLMSEGFVVD